jgi:hypothetical protein
MVGSATDQDRLVLPPVKQIDPYKNRIRICHEIYPYNAICHSREIGFRMLTYRASQ